MSNIQSGYQDIYTDAAERVDAAYTAFKHTYETMNPVPTKPVETAMNWGWKQFGMISGMVGSVIVSGSHTIPVFIGVESMQDATIGTLILAFAVFVMIEMGILVFAYSSTEQQYKTNEDIRNRVKQFTRIGLYFIVFVAVSANVVNVVEHNISIPDNGLFIWSGVRLVIFLCVGFSAPVIAFITGEILAVDVLEHQSKFRRELGKYNELFSTWQDGLNRSWASQKRKWGASIELDDRVQRLSNVSDSLSTQTDNRQTGQGYVRVSSAVDTALEYLQNNPDAVNLTVRELGENAGVGKDSAAKARKQFLGE